jgi:adenine/guanine phosphoribosyltransferase-like PRPP-binding protein
MVFDPNQKNVAPMYLGTVHNGSISYRKATMERDQPYARVGEDGVSYAGPHEDVKPAGSTVNLPARVVLFGKGADEVAHSNHFINASASADRSGVKWEILSVSTESTESNAQDWGKASTALVHVLMDEHALVVIALDRDAAHLAEQLSLKSFVPVVAISDDRSLTSTAIPWIFRLPSGTAPDAALKLIQAAVEKSGANRERLRDVLASGSAIAGFAFLPTGEQRGQ